MSQAAVQSFDKNVVDRRRPGRDADLARALRGARERLVSTRGLAPRFERELLIRHGMALATGATVLPLPVLLAAFGLWAFVGPAVALLWGTGALAGVLVLLLTGRAFRRRARERFDPASWTLLFQSAHALNGLAWAVLGGIGCSSCGPFRFEIFQFTTLLVGIALTAMVSSTLRRVVVITFLPLAVVLAARIAADPDPLAAAMRAVLVGIICLFGLVASRLREDAVERMKHQAEKDELIAELETARVMSDEARRRAEDANLAKSRFLATMSHELRTPLNAILGFSEVIAGEILGPLGNDTYKEYVADIHASGKHLLDLINEILDLSRIEAGRYTLNEEAVDLAAIARDCLNYIQLKADAKAIVVTSEFERDLPQIWGDPRALRQVVLNLLSNAVKFAPGGGEIVLRVGWTAGGGQYVSVKDDGPGIPEDEIPIVLSSFGQGSIAIKSAEQGTGLGLPIVQALVQLHDGKFELHSRLREGTEAIVIFPHARVLEIMPAFA